MVTSGCALLRMDEIRSRAESAFRHHNEVSSELMLVLPGIPPGDELEMLEQAEARMISACGPLDRLAGAYRDGEEVSLADKKALVRALQACECETQRTEHLLKGQSPSSEPPSCEP
jgi:hypothetical protein